MQGANTPLSRHSNLCRFVRKITADIIFINVYYVNNVCYKSIQADDLTWICMRHERGVLGPCITHYFRDLSIFRSLYTLYYWYSKIVPNYSEQRGLEAILKALDKREDQTILMDSPETIRKMCLSTKFPHQEIRWNYGVFCSDIYTYM